MRESAEHAALVELFRHHPALAATLVRRVGEVVVPDGCLARVGDPMQKPAALVPDVVIELRDADGALRLVIVVEVQRGVDDDKLYTWPAYLWIERLRRRCECVLRVVATRRDVAAWARRPIEGGPGNTAQLVVLGPDDVPRITSFAEARADPLLAVLSAGLHGGGEGDVRVMRAGVVGLSGLPASDAAQYKYLVFRALSERTIAVILEDIMQELQKDEDEGHLASWYAYWEERGERRFAARDARARAEVLLRQLAGRGFTVDDETRARVLACEDGPQLDVWLDRVLTATSLADVLA